VPRQRIAVDNRTSIRGVSQRYFFWDPPVGILGCRDHEQVGIQQHTDGRFYRISEHRLPTATRFKPDALIQQMSSRQRSPVRLLQRKKAFCGAARHRCVPVAESRS